MRVPLALLVGLAVVAGPASAAAPRGVTFTDPAGDANGLDGAHDAGSRPEFDVVRVRITPYAATRRVAGLAIRVDLADTPSTAPGSSYVLTAVQDGCDITVSRTATADGYADSTLVSCGRTKGEYHSSSALQSFRPSGRSVTFTVPPEALPSAVIGARLTDVEVGTATGEPVSGFAAPARIDRAVLAGTYAVGS